MFEKLNLILAPVCQGASLEALQLPFNSTKVLANLEIP